MSESPQTTPDQRRRDAITAEIERRTSRALIDGVAAKHTQRTIGRAKARHRRMSRNVDAIAAERAAVERIKP